MLFSQRLKISYKKSIKAIIKLWFKRRKKKNQHEYIQMGVAAGHRLKYETFVITLLQQNVFFPISRLKPIPL